MYHLNLPYMRTVTLAIVAKTTNSIKTTVATDKTTPQHYISTDFNGALGGKLLLPRTISVTTTTASACYNTTDPIVVTGVDINGTAVTDNLLLTNAGGNETVVSTKAFLQITSIDVPVQLDTTGSFVFGTVDVYPGGEVQEIRVGTGGTLVMVFQDGSTDTMTAANGEHLQYSPIAVKGTSSAAAVTFAFKK